ncbi:MAG: LysM peptidoglycan-binding domain-containing protein [Nitrososphaerales archaeon]
MAFAAILTPIRSGAASGPSAEVTYTVQPGDSLYFIGKKFGVPWPSLAQANNIISPYIIYVGEVLVISGSTSSTTTSSSACSQSTAVAPYYYSVEPGDYLSLIGARFGVPWQVIAQANNIYSPYIIYVGQQLLIPAGSTSTTESCSSVTTSTPTTTTTSISTSSTSSTPTSSTTSSSTTSSSTSPSTTTSTESSSSYIIYSVKPGDYLYLIGHEYNVPWQQIAQLNGISAPYILYVGEQLEILLQITSSTTSASSTTTSTTTSSTVTSTTTTSTNSTGSSPRYVMIRFDDSFQDQWVYALPILEEYGFKACFATIAGDLTNSGISSNITDGWQRMSWQEIESLYASGNQIVDHTMTHPDLTQISSSQLYVEVVGSRQLLASHGIPNSSVMDLALPYGSGADNQTLLNFIYGAGYSHVYTAWGVPGLLNYSTIQTQWIGIDAADNDLSLSQFESYASMASSTFAVGFMFHHINDHVYGTTYYDNVSSFAQDMAYLYSAGYTVIIPMQLPGY